MVYTKLTGDAPLTELDRLAGQADQLHQEGGDQEGETGSAAAAPPMTNAQVLATAFDLVRETLCTVAGVSSPRLTVSTEKLAPLADAWGAVLDKHGIDLSGMVGDYILEFKAIALTVPVIMAARNALQSELEQKRANADVTDVTEKPAAGGGHGG